MLLKTGEYQVVAAAASKPVEVTAGGTVTVRLLEGGTTSGVPKKRGEKWFTENVEALFLGALVLPDGRGAASKFDGTGSVE